MVTLQPILPPGFQTSTEKPQENMQPSTKKGPASPIRPPLIDMTNSTRPPVTIILTEDPTVKPTQYTVSNVCTSKKRTHAAALTGDSPTSTTADAFDDGESETDHDADDDLIEELDMSCDVVRKQIREFLSAGTTAVAFRKLIRATPGSYNGFMKQVGRDGGIGSDTYRNAVLFFAKRERRARRAAAANPGAPATVVPILPLTEATSEPAAKRKKQAKETPTPKRGSDNSAYDVSDIHLPGEERDAVPVYDTCDDIRTKIRAHFRQPNCTQAALLRQLGAQFILNPRALRSPQINTFMGQKGPLEGNSSGIFYGAYVFFEKLRLKNGKPKSKKREEMEKRWGRDGVDRTAGGGYWCGRGEVPVQDSFGCVTFHRR